MYSIMPVIQSTISSGPLLKGRETGCPDCMTVIHLVLF
ncbi:MAG: hypothetical protein ACJAU6_002619 [Alphaproteobacteria bacterium]|jgi:hypothetical protein